MLQILLAISIVCVLALVWITLAIARHITASRRTDRWNSDDIPVIVPHVDAYQAPQPKLREQRTIPEIRQFREFRHEFVAASQMDIRIPQSDLRQSARDISANKSWTMPTRPLKTRLLTREPVFRSVVANGQVETGRKPPQTSRHGVMRRLDPAYFNKDSGDLTDPYEQPRAGIRTASQRVNRNRR